MQESEQQKLVEAYPWLSISNSVEEYVEPAYYKRLLKEYSFNGRSDLEYLEDYVKGLNPTQVLELGCGSGRATGIALANAPDAKFELVDLSSRMIASSKQLFVGRDISFQVQDAVTFLSETERHYDFVYSLWSFSHSVHQHVHELGFEKAKSLLTDSLSKFIRENLNTGGKFFLMHFDSKSDEQEVLMNQWKRVLPEFEDTTQQSPSKRIIDSVLIDLDNRDEIVLSVSHYRGDNILYSNEDEVLETFLNFHMETFFNDSSILGTVLNDVRAKIQPFKQADGTFLIQPGCYIYSFEKQ